MSTNQEERLQEYRWLVGADAGELLRELAAGDEPLLAAAQRLRKSYSPQRTHLLLEQVELRRRAEKKFHRAAEMFFTRRGLEQATDECIAARKAKRFAGCERVADLCCGIGGDLAAIAARGLANGIRTTGIDHDPVTRFLAAANLDALGLRGDVLSIDVSQFDLCGVDAWHIDPDRRVDGTRTTHPDAHGPSPSAIEQLIVENRNAAVKLASGTTAPDDWQAEAELEWISHDRECRQQIAWFGNLAAEPGQRRATRLHAEADLATFVAMPTKMPVADRVGRYLYEPDPAILAANLTGALAEHRELAAIEAGIPYLTGDSRVDEPLLAAFEIVSVLPFDERRVKTLLKERRIGQMEVKKRGVPHDPETVRRALATGGVDSATLFLTRRDGAVIAILAKRLTRTN